MGASLAGALAARGADVALSYSTSGDAARATVASVQAQGRRAAAFSADLSKPSSCQGLIDDVLTWAGRLDVLVCLASRYERVPLDELTPDGWRSQLAVDLDGSFHCARAAAAHMRTRRSGHIVLCSDWVAASGRPRYSGYVPYYVAKAGVVALTEALALELAPDDVQVNAVAPGSDPARRRVDRGDAGRRDEGHPAGSLGWPRRRHARDPWTARPGVGHRPDHPRRWRTAPGLTQQIETSQLAMPRAPRASGLQVWKIEGLQVDGRAAYREPPWHDARPGDRRARRWAVPR